jgi:hypothetical protein
MPVTSFPHRRVRGLDDSGHFWFLKIGTASSHMAHTEMPPCQQECLSLRPKNFALVPMVMMIELAVSGSPSSLILPPVSDGLT